MLGFLNVQLIAVNKRLIVNWFEIIFPNKQRESIRLALLAKANLGYIGDSPVHCFLNFLISKLCLIISHHFSFAIDTKKVGKKAPFNALWLKLMHSQLRR